MTRILIPTPLRAYTDKQEAVEAAGATIGEALADLTATIRRSAAASLHAGRPAAQLRQRLRERRRHPLPAAGGDAAQDRATSSASSRRSPADRPPKRRRQAPADLTCRRRCERYSRHLIMPEVGMDGQRRLKAASVLCIGAGGLGSPAALYLAAAGVGRLGIVDFDVVDFSNLQRQILHGTTDVGRPKLQSARERLHAINPGDPDRDLRDGAHVEERARPVSRLRRHPRRHRQLSDALSGERRVRAAGQAERLRQHLPLRGAGVGVRRAGRAVLPLPVSRAAAARPGAELRGRRRARRAAGRDRDDPGDRGDQADPRRRPAARRPAAALRRADDAVPRAEAAARSGLPGLRRPSDGPAS